MRSTWVARPFVQRHLLFFGVFFFRSCGFEEKLKGTPMPFGVPKSQHGHVPKFKRKKEVPLGKLGETAACKLHSEKHETSWDILGSRPIQPGVPGDHWWGVWFPVPAAGWRQQMWGTQLEVRHCKTSTPPGNIGIAPRHWRQGFGGKHSFAWRSWRG